MELSDFIDEHATYELQIPVQSDDGVPTESEIARALEAAGILGAEVERL